MANYAGTAGDDTYTGTDTADTINGNGGNDALSGGAGDDTINGGDGLDRLVGGAGADTMTGGNGIDMLFSHDAGPVTYHPYGDDQVSSDIWADVDTLSGGADDDYLFAGYGDNVDGGAVGSYGNRLYISFQGATQGVTADFRLLQNGQSSITIGGGVITNIQNIGYLEGSEFNDFLAAIDTYYPAAGDVFGRGGDDHIVANYYTGYAGSTLNGGDGNDLIDATAAQYGPAVFGDAGDDVILTGSQGGVANGGAGNDTITGAATAHGDAGNDIINAQPGYYGAGMYGDAGNDTLNGSAAGDTLIGGSGADNIKGNDGNDVLYSGVPEGVAQRFGSHEGRDLGLERDTLTGGLGDDLISIGYGDHADGGADFDGLMLSFAGATAGVTLDTAAIVTGAAVTIGGGTIKNFEYVSSVFGSAFADTITVAAQTPPIDVFGGDGADVLTLGTSGGGLRGEAGNDMLIGGSSGETFRGGAGADIINAGGGDDAIYIDNAETDLQAGDQMDGGAGWDTLRVIITTSNPVDLTGFALTNIEALYLGDYYTYGTVLVTAAQYDGLSSAAGTFQLTTGGSISLAGMNSIGTLRLSDLGNVVDGTGAASSGTIIGGAGNDVISGLGGDSTLNGEGGNDQLTGGDGRDVLNGGDGNDILKGGEGGDQLSGGKGADTLKGEGGDDTFYLSQADLQAGDSFDGGAGQDMLTLSGDTDISQASLTGIEVLRNDYGVVNLTRAQLSGFSTVFASVRLTDGGSVSLAGINFTGSTIYLSNAGNTIDLTGVLGGSYGSYVYSVAGGTGNDMVTGSSQSDGLSGGGGDDTLSGGAGNDGLRGGAGVDTLKGETGDDYLIISGPGDVQAGDVFNGGIGTDTLYIDGYGYGGVDISGATIIGVEALSSYYSNEVRLTASQLTSFAAIGTTVRLTTGGDITLTGVSLTGNAINLSDTGTRINLTDAVGSSYFTVNGGAGNDVITGGEFSNDQLSGGGGDDELHGAGGNDTLRGDAGNDIFFGGAGNDTYYGGTGDDFYFVEQGDQVFEYVGEGIDTVVTAQTGYTLGVNVENLAFSGPIITTVVGTGNGLDNQILARDGADTLKGLAGNDKLHGLGGNDRLEGGQGDDQLFGDAGKDIMIGGTGDDIYYVDSTTDVVTELAGEGNDAVIVNGGTAYTLGANVERLEFEGSGGFAGTGNADGNVIMTTNAGGDDMLKGMAGDDWLWSGTGNDTLDGGTGNDVLNGGAGDDTYIVDSAADAVTEFGGEGTDTVRSSVSFTLGANIENLTLTGGAAINATGNDLVNILIGNGSANILDGGLGADRMEGGNGGDTYRIDNANDVIVEANTAAGGADKAMSSVNYTLKAGVAVETLTTDNDLGVATINLNGNEFANRILGNAGTNALSGGQGDDRLEGLDGNDTLNGGAGADLMIGGAGSDVYVVDNALDKVLEVAGGGTDSITLMLAGGSYTIATEVERMVVMGANTEAHGNSFANVLTASAAGVTLYGEGGNDTLNGSANADIFHGGVGNDLIKGLGGADVFVFDTTLSAVGNADTLVDFEHGIDTIELSGTVFGAIGAGTLDASAFGTGTAATTADQRIVYDTATGKLFYDADGSGAGAQVLFAVLQNKPADLAASDFHGTGAPAPFAAMSGWLAMAPELGALQVDWTLSASGDAGLGLI